MAGCFGNHPIDRWIEKQTMDYLDELDTFYCPKCGFKSSLDDEAIYYDEDRNIVVCPQCKTTVEL